MGKSSSTAPNLTIYRDDARDWLIAFYAPYSVEMTVDRSVAEFDINSTIWQKKYESIMPIDPAVRAGVPGWAVATGIDASGYPAPLAYLVNQFLSAKAHEIFQEPEHKHHVASLCYRRGATQQWVEQFLEDVLGNTVQHLLSSHSIPAAERTEKNDYQLFLKAWAATHGLPEHKRRYQQLNLIRSPADNTFRRMGTAEPRERTGLEAADLERLAVCGDRWGGHVSDSITACHALTPNERQALTLRFVTGLVFREIAELMNMPLSTVYGLCEHGLQKLADVVDPAP